MKKRIRLSAKDRGLLKKTLRELNLQGRLQEEKLAKQHGRTSVYQHSIHVAYLSLWLAAMLRLRADRKALVRGALLHDYFLYDWHEKGGGHRLHGFRHGQTAAKNARRDYALKPLEEYIIARHMFPLTILPPKSKEGWMVCLADKWCAVKETLQPFFKRRRYNKKSPCKRKGKSG